MSPFFDFYGRSKFKMQEFTEDWLLYDSVLGEGAYGEVRLLVHRRTKEQVACKIIDHVKYKDAAANINREVVVHRLLDHPNIIRYLGRRNEPTREYIFLEYAAGGELFQMIEPDVGMPSKDAQRYFIQLLDGLKYLHSKGITHRDIKPENLLIDGNGVLKISDFGLATVFRMKGKERTLQKKCGTKPYIAPEVLDMQRPYKAQPADVWSCGIVFVAMLAGELPWTEPTDQDREFINYKEDNYMSSTPWSKLGNTALSLVRGILHIDPYERFTIEKIMKHPWMKFTFNIDETGDSTDGTTDRPPKRFASMMETETRRIPDCCDVALSQPVMSVRTSSIYELVHKIKSRREQLCFSQPAHNDDLILSSQIQFTQSPITKENFDKLTKRMTRFYVKTAHEKTLELLCKVLDSYHFVWSSDTSGSITIVTVDEMKNPLTFKANIINMEGKLLLDFRLSKGCGLGFKKKFMKIRTGLKEIID